MQGITQAVFNFSLVAGAFHVDEVDNDQTTQVTQAKLAGDLVGRFLIGFEGSFLDVATLGRTTRVNVHRNQRFRVIDDDGTTGRQVDLTGVGRFDLMFDLEA